MRVHVLSLSLVGIVSVAPKVARNHQLLLEFMLEGRPTLKCS